MGLEAEWVGHVSRVGGACEQSGAACEQSGWGILEESVRWECEIIRKSKI